MKPALLIAFAFLVVAPALAQDKTDTIRPLKTVVVESYFSSQPVLTLPASVSVINQTELKYQSPVSMVSVLNTVPGVRMEERSPGSYRLSIRGSLLRSPFGVRDVKIYMDGFPLTDAGGNTYLNLIDMGSIEHMEVLKGPEASIYGANSGGVLLLNPANSPGNRNSVSAALNSGSYGLFYERASLTHNTPQNAFQLFEAYQHSDGYRRNSALNRKYIQANNTWKYSGSAQLKSLVFYSDMDYQTPGGLTEQQMLEDPQAARPASGNTPGAEEQLAGIYNKTFFAGLLNEWRISARLRHVAAVFGSHTDFKNPFITNYELRNETTGGLRTYLELNNPEEAKNTWHWQLGVEGSNTASDISNYDNIKGQRGNLQSADQINALQYFIFTHFAININEWQLEAALSLNDFGYRYGTLNTPSRQLNSKKFTEQLMPRFAASYQLSVNAALRASVSRGYSSPTIAEVRASDKVINTSLQPESGWNYEAGLRAKSNNDRLFIDAVIFNYHLQNAIVRRLTSADAEYFINAGGTRQPGMELQFKYWLLKPSDKRFIRGIQIGESYSFSDFKFSDYISGTDNFSGKDLTGVPRHVAVSSLKFLFPSSLYFFAQHNFTSAIPLNDANSAYAKAYHLVQLKAGWQKPISQHADLSISAGLDNLLNVVYSLGNDLNAFGGRYYNPSPGRNFYFGLALNLI